MAIFRIRIFAMLLLAFPLIFLTTACDPVQDDTLSPPIVRDPIHSCSEIIAYSGADRDAEIWIYVNGSKVHEFKTWMGWGAAKLPVKLDLGDKVTLRQVVHDRISSHSRDEVTVVDPPRDHTNERLTTPKIKEPLIECQKLVIVEETVEGATTELNKNGAPETSGMSPYPHIRLGVPELRTGDGYKARQRLCLKSDGDLESLLSDKAEVQAKPSELPKPTIHEPLVQGSDACQVDDLFVGARVEIHAKDDSNDVVVGGGTAQGSSTIFGVSPVLDLSKEYYAVQYLCELASPESDPVKPQEDPPAPTIQPPICKDGFYVTVCDTVVISTVRVFIDGVQVAQTAGNGGCVRMALGNATTFPEGKKVAASQSVDTRSSPLSADVEVEADGSPPYDPGKWNHADWIHCNNCYNYGCDIRTDNFAQPGHASGASHSRTCPTVGSAAESDGLTVTDIEKKCWGCTHLVALVVDPLESSVPGDRWDYHWYRMDDNGRWSHKPGGTPATERDASGNLITNPETADRRSIGADYTYDYSLFCGYYCVDKGVVSISGYRSCD
jgi:hypothetical protein